MLYELLYLKFILIFMLEFLSKNIAKIKINLIGDNSII